MTRRTAPLTQNVRPTADGRANGPADEPRWLRPPAADERADGTDSPARHGSPADPLESVCVLVYTFDIEESEPPCLNSIAYLKFWQALWS
jgi:hypothetical protein